MRKPNGLRVAFTVTALGIATIVAVIYLGWPRIRFWYRFEPLGRNAQGFSEYKHRKTAIVMVLLPGGRFWMGAQKEDPSKPNYDPDAEDDEGPVHEVTLSPFLIGKYGAPG